MADSQSLPEIKESDATGVIADIYSDIRYSLRVPMVNLIFRHMATVPGCLEWVWGSIGPVYVSGKVVAAADQLLANSSAISLAVPVKDDAREGVLATCAAYSRANPANLLGLKALGFILAETPGARARRKPTRGAMAKPIAIEMPQLPPMADLASMSEEQKKILVALTHQLHGPDGRVVPSFYRHLTAWPALLEGIHIHLQPIIDDGTLTEAAAALDHAAHGLARVLYLDCPVTPLAPPSEAAATTLRDLIELFPPNICKMTLIARALGASITSKRSN